MAEEKCDSSIVCNQVLIVISKVVYELLYQYLVTCIFPLSELRIEMLSEATV